MRLARGLAALALATTLAGCALTPSSEPARKHVYRLGIGAELQLPRYQEAHGVLMIQRPQADPGYDTRGIVFREHPQELRHYSRSRWAEPPARMLETGLVAALETSGLFSAVLRSPAAAAADYRLRTELLSLEQVLRPGQASTVELALRVQLIGDDPRRVLASRLIRTAVPTDSEDALGAVQAAQAAVDQALVQVVELAAEGVARDSRRSD